MDQKLLEIVGPCFLSPATQKRLLGDGYVAYAKGLAVKRLAKLLAEEEKETQEKAFEVLGFKETQDSFPFQEKDEELGLGSRANDWASVQLLRVFRQTFTGGIPASLAGEYVHLQKLVSPSL